MTSPKSIASSGTAAGAFKDDKNATLVTANGNGYLMLTPTFTSGTISGGGIISGTPIKVTLDANDIPSSGQSMYTSDQFSSPVNPAFRVRVFNGNDSLVADLGNCVISGAAPVDLTTLTASSNGVTYNGAVLLNPTGQQTINGQNLVMEGAALGFSAAASTSGDVFLNRQAANKAGLGTTQSAKDATLLLGKLATGGTEATGSVAGDITAARAATQGTYYLGTDGNGQLLRNGDTLQLAGTTKTHTFPANTGTIAELNLAQNFTALQQFSAGISPNGSNTLTLPAATDTLAALAATQTLTNKSLGGTGSTTPDTAYNRTRANRGSSLVTGDFGTLSGWGTTATVSAVTGTDAAGTVTISSSGTGQAANPSFVFTYHDGGWGSAPIAVFARNDSNAPTAGQIAAAFNTTAATFVFINGTPVAGTTYTFSFIVIGK